MNDEKVLNEVINLIISRFPLLNVFVKYKQEADEYFILIDSKEVFNSIEFSSLLTEIDLDIFSKLGLYNIYVSYLLGNEECSSQIYAISKYKNDERSISNDTLISSNDKQIAFEYKSDIPIEVSRDIAMQYFDLGHDQFSSMNYEQGDQQAWKTLPPINLELEQAA
ncbi:MAG: hypothetical protein ACYC5N_04500 [Endomicrobiales bacterium]